MKVKLLQSVSYPDVTYSAGDEIDIDDGEAKRFIEKEIAIPAGRQAKVETATAKPAKEKAVTRAKKKK